LNFASGKLTAVFDSEALRRNQTRHKNKSHNEV
jgi:hypothetical protein